MCLEMLLVDFKSRAFSFIFIRRIYTVCIASLTTYKIYESFRGIVLPIIHASVSFLRRITLLVYSYIRDEWIRRNQRASDCVLRRFYLYKWLFSTAGLCGDTFTLGLRSLPCCISVPTVNQKLLARVNSLTVLGRGMSSLSGSNALTWLPWWHRDPRQVVRNFKDNYTSCP